MAATPDLKKWRVQGTRYVVIGLLSNAVLYLAYLGLTAVGVGHKSAMTALFGVGTLQTFVFNRRWTFDHDGHVSPSLLRYLVAYGGCYLLNLALLYVLVDRLGLPHAPIQGLAVLCLAVLLFVLQKFWVFRQSATPDVATGDVT